MKTPTFADDIREVLSSVAKLTGITATAITEAENPQSRKARSFCIFALKRKGHPPEKIAAAFSMSWYEPRKSHAKIDQRILEAVANTCGVPPSSIIEGARTPMVCRARFLFAAVIKAKNPWLCHADLSSMMGKKDHTTAMNRLKRADYLLDTDPAFKSAFDRAMAALEKTC